MRDCKRRVLVAAMVLWALGAHQAAWADGAGVPRWRSGPFVPPPTKAQVARYQKGVAALKQAVARDRQKPLQAGTRSQFLVQQKGVPKGTVLLLHGFSAGTYQVSELAQKYFAKGYNVYTPRLPGHGYKKPDGTPDPSQLPKSTDWKRYSAFGDKVYQQVEALGGPVHVVGLSGGGAVAAEIAMKHKVDSYTGFAPFLRPAKLTQRVVAGLAMAADKVTGGMVGRLMDKIPATMPEAKARAQEWGRPGHWKMKLGNTYALSRYGKSVIKRSDAHWKEAHKNLPAGPISASQWKEHLHQGQINVPMQVVTTGTDRKAHRKAIEKVWRRGGFPFKGWYHFAEAEGVPHAMLYSKENTHPAKLAEVHKVAVEFLSDNKKAVNYRPQ